MTADRSGDAAGGRAAVPEIAELLHLQRPAAGITAVAVVLLGLVVALVAPDVVPANLLTGLAVGVLALLAGVAAAVALDGRDPILRGPRHLRRDGHAVLARMAGPDAVQHGAPVLTALQRRLEGREHLSVVLTGTGTDPSRLAVALGRGAAADGHTALVIDLRAPDAPGVADVGAGEVRLGEAARLADDRPYAWIGAGTDGASAADAATGVVRRPPRDLQLLLVVAPEGATRVPALLEACERTVLLVAADTEQRAMVTARLRALHRAGARPEAVVVGGVRVVDEGAAGLADVAGGASTVPSLESLAESSPPTDLPPATTAVPEEGTVPDADLLPLPSVEPVEEEPEAAPAPSPAPSRADVAPASRPSRPDTGPLEPVSFRAAGAGRGTSVEGMADSDPLITTVALERLLAEQRHDRG